MQSGNWSPSGPIVFKSRYARAKEDGSVESWEDLVGRVVAGNLGIVPGDCSATDSEREVLTSRMLALKLQPAGRHLRTLGTEATFTNNCWHILWDDPWVSHFSFTFERLMEGGGVGSNYSNSYISKIPAVSNIPDVAVVCSSTHPDFDALKKEHVLELEDGPYENLYSVEDTREGWGKCIEVLVSSFFSDCVFITFDVSKVRSRGSALKAMGGEASGPLPLVRCIQNFRYLLSGRSGNKLSSLDLMELDHFIAEAVISGGTRRSSRMSLKHWKDEDIKEFIHCKDDLTKHWSTNISVIADDEFFTDISFGERFAERALREGSSSMYLHGEPGWVNISAANKGEVRGVTGCNPCGEIYLESGEPCCLGHVNLGMFPCISDTVSTLSLASPVVAEIRDCFRMMTRFLIRATFVGAVDPISKEVVSRNRRIGVGITGFQTWLVKNGIRYSKSHKSGFVRDFLMDMREAVRDEARRFAFSLRIPEPVKVTTVAPTGTISKLSGVSEGIHPIYAKYFLRRIRFSMLSARDLELVASYEKDGCLVEDDIYAADTKVVAIPTKDIIYSMVPEEHHNKIESAEDIPFRTFLKVQAMVQRYYADNGVSFTINFDPSTVDKSVIWRSIVEFLPKLKGFTVMPDASRPMAPYERISASRYAELRIRDNFDDSINEECASGACPI